MTSFILLTVAVCLLMSVVACAPAHAKLFPTDLPGRERVQFKAQGFSEPVCGVVYRLADRVTNGMALGGVDTGCIDLETSGLLGYCTIFNSHVPRRGPINLPLLGLSVGGETWVMCRCPGSELKQQSAWLPGDLGGNQRAWATSPGGVPGWCKSLGASRYDWPVGRVGCHTPAIVGWVSSISGDVEITGGIWLVRNLGRDQKWELRKNGVPFASGALTWGPNSANPQSYSGEEGGAARLTVAVEKGDVIELCLDKAGTYGDFVGVDLRIKAARADKVWDLAADWSDTRNPNGPWTYDGAASTALTTRLKAVQTVKEIHYWGHYPVADLEFDTDAPVSVGMRAWAPLLPGDVVDSMIPGIVFEVHLRNVSESPQQGTVALSFPGPTPDEALTQQFVRREVKGTFKGVVVTAKMASYALGVIGPGSFRLGGELGANGSAWANIATALPAPEPAQPGSSAAVDFSLAPGESKRVRFALTWCAPTWNGVGYNAATTVPEGYSGKPRTFTHMYAKRFPDAETTAQLLAKNHDSLLRRILAWQEVIYTDSKLPVWLRDSLINVLYMITEDGLWAQAEDPVPKWVREEDGLFGMNECPRGCPQIECIPCSFYGSLPIAYFFPELELSTLRGYKGYQYEDGAPPWIFGGCTGRTPHIDFAYPTRGYQFATNGISLASLADRFLMCHDDNDKRLLKELYPMIKKCMSWTVNLRTTPEYSIGERIISMPDKNAGTEWFEAPEPGWCGMTAHVGGLHVAQLRITERMAKEVGDTEFAKQCEDWIKAAGEAMENRLWTGSYYLNFWEPDTGQKSDLVFGYQLDGEWITDHHGLPGTLPKDRVRTVLDTIKRCNVAVTRYGAVNYANPDGTPAKVGGYGTYSYFPPEALMLAMTYMYNGDRELGIELARKVWHNLVCLQGYTWDMPNIMRGDIDTGERTFGNDYYQDMMLWSLPAALEGKDLSAPVGKGGLVERIVQAARRK